MESPLGSPLERGGGRVSSSSDFESIAVVPLGDPSRASVYEHGWQSWSPAGTYSADLPASPRPHRPIWQTMAFRPGHPAPDRGFQGEGLLAVVPADGPIRLWRAADPARQVASIRARLAQGRLHISADGPVFEIAPPSSLAAGLASVGAGLGEAAGARPVRPIGPGWCSWYGYGSEVTDAAVSENLEVIEREGLDVRLIQIDDGHQAEIGDWLEPSGRIASMADLANRIRDGGREAGVWTAPFMVGERSRLAREHPEWLVRDAIGADRHWDQRIHVLDVTHPGAAAHLGDVFRTLRSWGFTMHKIDFLYGGAMDGGRHGDADAVAAYREGLRIIRAALGDDATILGCGAPLLPSIGLVDAMRISPDTDLRVEPLDGDVSQPSQRGAMTAGRAREWMHGRLWVNDPDCIIAAPDAEDREGWATYLQSSGGLAMSGDRLAGLDRRGLELTRTLLRPSATEVTA